MLKYDVFDEKENFVLSVKANRLPRARIKQELIWKGYDDGEFTVKWDTYVDYRGKEGRIKTVKHNKTRVNLDNDKSYDTISVKENKMER